MKRQILLGTCVGFLTSCGGSPIGTPPALSPVAAGPERAAMFDLDLPARLDRKIDVPAASASLWTGERGSLLGDRRAIVRGDILTVVIEIDDSAEISNTSNLSRNASQDLGIPQLFGIPQRLDRKLPEGASSANAVSVNSNSDSSGSGSVRRNEKLTLRVAATIENVLPNGVLSIIGQQEIRVNSELRELIVSGFVRPADISRQNEVTYDKIASARISYGGRGQIADVQQPRYGQQILEKILPF